MSGAGLEPARPRKGPTASGSAVCQFHSPERTSNEHTTARTVMVSRAGLEPARPRRARPPQDRLSAIPSPGRKHVTANIENESVRSGSRTRTPTKGHDFLRVACLPVPCTRTLPSAGPRLGHPGALPHRPKTQAALHLFRTEGQSPPAGSRTRRSPLYEVRGSNPPRTVCKTGALTRELTSLARTHLPKHERLIESRAPFLERCHHHSSAWRDSNPRPLRPERSAPPD